MGVDLVNLMFGSYLLFQWGNGLVIQAGAVQTQHLSLHCDRHTWIFTLYEGYALFSTPSMPDFFEPG
jgi:hypothetical protein